MAIHALHWDMLDSMTCRGQWLSDYPVVALWPAPVNADECFARAGFEDFADADECWETEWRHMIANALVVLLELGDPIIQEAALARETPPLWRRGLRLLFRSARDMQPSQPLLDQIECVTTDDRFGQVKVQFGSGPRAMLQAGHGHELLFVQLACEGDRMLQRLLSEVAANRPAKRTRLEWRELA